MSLEQLATEPRLQRILTHPDDDNAVWRGDLERFLSGDATLTRKSAGEAAVMAVPRLMIFLGYSTAASAGFLVDGDYVAWPDDGSKPYAIAPAFVRANYQPVG